MLVCKFEFWPGGEEAKKIEIGSLRVVKDCGKDYLVDIPKSKYYRTDVGMVHYARIKGFDFKRRTFLDLLYRALKETVGQRNAHAGATTMEKIELEHQAIQGAA